MLPFLWNVFISPGTARSPATTRGRPTPSRATSSPAAYNFDRLPEIRSERPLFDARHGLVDPHSTPPIPPSVAAGEDELTTTPDSKARRPTTALQGTAAARGRAGGAGGAPGRGMSNVISG